MISRHAKNKHKTIAISENECRQLVFWAVYGVGKANYGSYPEIVETLKELIPRLKMQTYHNGIEFGFLK